MSISNSTTVSSQGETLSGRMAPDLARLAFCGVLVIGAGVGAGSTGSQETVQALAQAGPDWAHLLRAMAALKTVMAVAGAAAVVWRLASPAKPAWLAAYGSAGMAMMAGPGLIWGLAHIGLGALLLHAGLAATLMLLWCDPQLGTRLAALVAARRAAMATNPKASVLTPVPVSGSAAMSDAEEQDRLAVSVHRDRFPAEAYGQAHRRDRPASDAA